MSEPIAPGRSAGAGMSDGGRLSITNQPRSSRLLAAELRPAPDIPAITTKALTRRPIVVAAVGAARSARQPASTTAVMTSTSRYWRWVIDVA